MDLTKNRIENENKSKGRYMYLKFVPSISAQPKSINNGQIVENNPNEDYLTISNTLRSNICVGYPVARGSHSRIVHNANIFKEHFENLALGTNRHSQSFGRKKDWLGRWTEANIVRDRLMKDMVNAQKKINSNDQTK